MGGLNIASTNAMNLNTSLCSRSATGHSHPRRAPESTRRIVKMRNRRSRIGRVAASASAPCTLALSLAGCSSLYGTPRTIPKGEVQHTVAIEGIAAPGSGFGYGVQGAANVSYGGMLPTLPTYELRYGTSDRVDVGFRFANMTALGFDAKWNFHRGHVDLAIDPSLQAIVVPTTPDATAVVYGHLPLLVGVNLSPRSAIVFSPGVALFYTSSHDTGTQQWTPIARCGIGFQRRINPQFAIQPVVTTQFAFGPGGVSAPLLSFGVGFLLGAQPNTDDLK